MKSPTMIYSQTEGEKHEDVFYKVVDAEEVKKYLKKGWYATPSEVPKDEKTLLESEARKYGVDLDRRKSVAKLRKEVESLKDEHRN